MRKLKISKRVTILNFTVMAVMLAVFASVATATISGITENASRRLAYVHSLDSASSFLSHVDGDLSLLRTAAQSPSVGHWFADEANEEKKYAAFETLADIVPLLNLQQFYFGILSSLNKYMLTPNTTAEAFDNHGRMLVYDPIYSWFFNSVHTGRDILFNVDIDGVSHASRIWANYRVTQDSRPVGVLSVSFKLDEILYSMFGQYDYSHVRGYIVDQMGFIHMSSASIEFYDSWLDRLVHITSLDSNLASFVSDFTYSQGTGFFTDEIRPKIRRISGNPNFDFAAIAPISNSELMVLTLFNSTNFFGVTDVLPLIAVLVMAFAVYMLISTISIQKMVIRPLVNLRNTITELEFSDIEKDEGLHSMGKTRSDEVGDISNSIQNMLNEIKKSNEREREVTSRQLQIYNASPIPSSLWSADLKPLDCNDAMVKLLEMESKDDFLYDFMRYNPEVQPSTGITTAGTIVNVVKNVMEHGVMYYHYHFISRSGELIPGDCVATRVDLKGETFLSVHFQDMRKVNALIDKQTEMRERLAVMFDATPLAVECWNLEFSPVDCNQTALNLQGYSTKEEYLSTPHKTRVETQPNGTESVEYWNKHLARIFRKGSGRFDYVCKDSYGRIAVYEVEAVCVKYDGELAVLTYSKDITLLLEMQKERQRVEVAEESNKAKTRFLARMSHEIRTPISAVLGISEIQLQHSLLPPEVEEAFVVINSSANLLLNIVNDILDLSKIEAGKMELLLEEYNVAHMISDVTHPQFVNVDNRGVKFNVIVEENLPAILIGDVVRIKQIISNILSNAFKYTEVGSVELYIKCSKSDAINNSLMLSITIIDTGLGMNEEQLTNLYEEYIRFHERENRSISGTGLGIPIVYNLVQMMDASIDIKSSVGTGTSVFINIPQKIGSDEVLGSDTVARLQYFETSSKTIAQKFKFMPEPMPYGRVLVVDDVKTNLYVAEGLLSFYDLHVETCESGFDAIDKIKQGKTYDIIFMDHMMPGLNGTDTMKKIKALGYKGAVIVLTANALIGQAEQFITDGFEGFISKPIQTSQLNAALIKHIKENQPPEVIKAAQQTRKKRSDGQTIEDFQNDAKFQTRLQTDFVNNHKNTQAELAEAINKGDFNKAHLLAHSLKGISRLIKEEALAEIAAEIEICTENNQVPESLEKLNTELAKALEKFSLNPAKSTETQEILNQLEPLLTSRRAESIDTAKKLRHIPEAAILIKQIEKFDFPTAIKSLKVLRELSE